MSEPGTVYLSLKLASQMFSKSLEALAPDELRRVSAVAEKQREIEALILTTPEAANVMLPETSVGASLMEIRARYGNEQDYLADLERIGLTPETLSQAVERDMVVEAVLEKVAARSATVSETEVEIFWFMHKDRFRRPETRKLRHILITINDTLPGSERDTVKKKIDGIRTRLVKDPSRFAEQALKHSECPTAMSGGVLGDVPRGQLYPEIEAVAFELETGAISEPVESEMGYHLVYCEAIQPERIAPLNEARATIRTHLETQRRSLCQKSWINALRRKAVAEAA